ncbi:cholesterol 25-hydroxylase-like protein [Betta splendens]|uniref:Cholesterol 25-hydroxylase-like protein n=1 Tax=Betta splendens TaxID=158456 RepID=A0A6P7KQ45_BETSP|nr:cholesterol 25-hydroxylase-like protein [Betta splendens]
MSRQRIPSVPVQRCGRMTDAESGHFMQAAWDAVKGRRGLLQSAFFPVGFSLTVYLSCCLPYLCLDWLCPRVALLRRFKILPHSKVTRALVWRCFCKIVSNHVCLVFPLSLVHWYWNPITLPPLAPGVPSVAAGVLACLLLFDTQYFFWHLLHHKAPWLYHFAHREHHLHTATFSLMTEDTGAWELLSLGFFSTLNAALLGCHPLTQMLFFVANIYLSVEAHSGYDFPWSPHRLVPFGLYGGARHHSLHHISLKVNYAPYFTHWDRLLGTLRTDDMNKQKRL